MPLNPTSQPKAGLSTKFKPGEMAAGNSQRLSNSKSNQPGPSKTPKRASIVRNYPMYKTTMSGLPLHVRSEHKNLKFQSDSNEKFLETVHKSYEYKYGVNDEDDDDDTDDEKDDAEKKINNDPKVGHFKNHNYDGLVLRNPKTEIPGPTASTIPMRHHQLKIPINQLEFVSELARDDSNEISGQDKNTVDTDSSNAWGLPRHDKTHQHEHELPSTSTQPNESNSATSVRQMLLECGFLPTDSAEMLEFYKELEQQQLGTYVPYQHTSTSNMSLLEQREAAAAFAGPSKPIDKRQERIYGKKFMNRKNMATTEPTAEPHPTTFVNPKIKVPVARQKKLIENQLNKEKSLACPKMNAIEYDGRKRLLMNAAIKAYDYDPDKPTDEVLVDLVDTERDPILFHNIQHDDVASAGELNLNDFGLSDEEFKQVSASTIKAIMSLSGMKNKSPAELKTIFTGFKFPQSRPLDHFKGSIMGSVMREIEEENSHGFRHRNDGADDDTATDYPTESLSSVSNTNTTTTAYANETQENIRRHELAKQALENYKLSKQQRINSVQRPKEMKIISKQQQRKSSKKK